MKTKSRLIFPVKQLLWNWWSKKEDTQTGHILPPVLLFHRETGTGIAKKTDRPRHPIYPSCQLAEITDSHSRTRDEDFHACHFLRRKGTGLFRRCSHGVQHRRTGTCDGWPVQRSRRLHTSYQRKPPADSSHPRRMCSGNCLYSPMLSQENIIHYT